MSVVDVGGASPSTLINIRLKTQEELGYINLGQLVLYVFLGNVQHE